MSKKLIALVVAAALSCSYYAAFAVQAAAYDETGDEITVDGVVFSKDKKCLISCPADKTGDYVIPAGTTHINAFAFQYCNLTGITLTDSLEYIGEFAFDNCKNLTKFDFSTSSPSIEDILFYSDFLGSCPKLERIDVDSANTKYLSLDGVLYNKSQTRLIRYPEGKSGAYVIPAGVKYIGDSAFLGGNVTKIYIPSSVEYIDQLALCGKDLTDIYYEGNEEQWESILAVDEYSLKASYLGSTPIHFLTKPFEEIITEPVTEVVDGYSADVENGETVVIDREKGGAIKNGTLRGKAGGKFSVKLGATKVSDATSVQFDGNGKISAVSDGAVISTPNAEDNSKADFGFFLQKDTKPGMALQFTISDGKHSVKKTAAYGGALSGDVLFGIFIIGVPEGVNLRIY